MQIYNSLSRQIENFEPLHAPEVLMYTCGPTVYNYATIGNFRTYTTADLFHRLLKANHYQVKYIMNITDVGHLTGDNLGDADTGEDRMEKAAQKEAKTVWDIAKHYTDAFIRDYHALNLQPPLEWTKATDYIAEQIELVKQLEEKGFTYATSDGIYFDTSKFPNYGELSTLDEIKEGARVQKNDQKKNPRDFALWKFAEPGVKRQMEWDSPWGRGFPGWHIECSAMSMEKLGPQLDVHFGGEDLRSTHHPNEIAQSEAVTGKQFVRYWVHSAFLKVDGQKMSKSLGNVYTVQDLVDKGYNPQALKYFYYTAHYRTPCNFTWQALDAAQSALDRLSRFVTDETVAAGKINQDIYNKFLAALNNDLNTASAIAVLQETLKDKILNDSDRKATLLACAEVLGFTFTKSTDQSADLPEEVKQLLKQRQLARQNKNWAESDLLRDKIAEHGYIVMDGAEGQKVIKKR